MPGVMGGGVFRFGLFVLCLFYLVYKNTYTNLVVSLVFLLKLTLAFILVSSRDTSQE